MVTSKYFSILSTPFLMIHCNTKAHISFKIVGETVGIDLA
jgi:hypothetical protein